VDVEGYRRTLVPGDSTDAGLRAEPDHAGEGPLLELDARQFSDWVQEVSTITTFFTGRDAGLRHGRIEEFLGWDLVLRALTEGRVVHEPGMVTFEDRQGRPLDLDRSFGPEDDPEDIGQFLRQAGFLHLSGWLDPADMAEIFEDITRALPTYEPDDGRSWWAKLEDGSQRCVRLQNFIEHSPTTARILSSDAWDKVRQVCDPGLVAPKLEGNVIEALVKAIGVVKGLSDLPWHRDCSLGRHPYDCPGVTVGISVTDSDADSGQLRVVAGSHRASIVAAGTILDTDLPIRALPTGAGDMTVHLSCTLHEAMPPVTGERRVMYSGYGLPSHLDERGAEARRRGAELRERAHKLQDQPPNALRARA